MRDGTVWGAAFVGGRECYAFDRLDEWMDCLVDANEQVRHVINLGLESGCVVKTYARLLLLLLLSLKWISV